MRGLQSKMVYSRDGRFFIETGRVSWGRVISPQVRMQFRRDGRLSRRDEQDFLGTGRQSSGTNAISAGRTVFPSGRVVFRRDGQGFPGTGRWSSGTEAMRRETRTAQAEGKKGDRLKLRLLSG